MSETAEDINFRPFTVLLGILLGTLFATAFGLLIVCLVFWILRNDEPRLLTEIDSLIASTTIFVALSVAAGLSFFASLRQRSWRYLPMAGLWLGLLMAGRYYWP
jgi:hypothetical protein